MSVHMHLKLFVLLFFRFRKWEAAYTIGMTYPQALKRVILPQATRVSIPPLSNTFISLVKDTSLASLILVTEMFQSAGNCGNEL